jgi:putative membrane protein
MKYAVLFAAAAVLSLAACQKQRDQAAQATNSVATSEPVNAAQDAASAAVGQAAATVGAVTTEGFVKELANSDMYEIKAGQIAQQKGQSAAVKAFGKQMVTDHTAMTNQMKPLILAANQTAPSDLDERHKGLIDNLNAASAADFDKAYLSQQEAAHQEALTLLQGYADKGPDAGLKGAAGKAVPKVQAHLDKVHDLQAAPPAAPAKK